jgi:TP901 family phage tail tape measure protein
VGEKDLNYNITGNSSGLEAASDRGSRALSKMEREARRLEAQQRKTHAAMEMVGRGMLVAGAAIAAGLVLSARAAIEWESAWAGVLKTVDGTPEQMAALEEEIRGLTAILPATHAEIAGVAEAAGQLGVQRQNVAAFTKVMIDMGEATNLSATDAATALARFMNIMQTAPGDVDRLGSAIVDLGNNSATTEAEIVEMALRIAGAGRSVGLTEAEVLGFSAALSSVGIAADAGGTAISRAFLTIDKSVREGGDSLDKFAEVAGMSSDEFVRAYQTDAAGAIDAFVQGLGRIQSSGGDVNATLTDLGLGEIRVSDALRRLSGSGDLLTRSLETGSDAWDENVALAEEAERRYGTTAAQMAIARNQVNDVAISIGSTLLPVLGDAASLFGSLAAVIGELPGPVKAALAIVAGLTAVLLLAGGAALIAVPRMVAFKQALDQIALSGGRAAAGVGAFRAASSFMLGPWGAAIAGAVAVATVAFGAWSASQANARAEAKEFADSLDQVTGALTDSTRALVAHKLEEEGALAAGRKLGLDLAELTEIVLSGEDAMRQLDEAVAAADNGYFMLDGTLVTTEATSSDLQRAIVILREAIGGTSGELRDGLDAWDRTSEAQEGTADATERLDPATRLLGEALNATADEAQDAAGEIDALKGELDALFGALFGVEEAQDAATEAMRRLTEEAIENGAKLDGNSEAALNNRNNVRDLIKADYDVITAMAEAGATSDELKGKTEELRQKFIDQMRQAGFSEAAIEEYADSYDEIPSIVETTIKTPGMTKAERNLRNLKLGIDQIPREVNVSVNINQARTLPGTGNMPNIAHKQHGGEIGGTFTGTDRQLIAATTGEFMIRRGVAQENLAALRALNATGRIPASLVRPAGGSSPETAYTVTTNVYPQRLDFGPRELEAVQAAQEARLRVGRPR